MSKEKEESVEKKPYTTPELTVHGDVEEITQGSALGENLDAGFTTDQISGKGRKKVKDKRFS